MRPIAARPAPERNHRQQAAAPAGSHHPAGAEAEEADNRRPAEADTHPAEAEAEAEAEAVGSYQGEVAVDRSWTPSGVKLAGNERAYTT